VYALSLAVDPTNPKVVYLGTGGLVGQGRGVYKSVDGGETWAPANQGMLDYRILSVAVDPAAPQTVYAGEDGGKLLKTTDGGQTWKDLSGNFPRRLYAHSSIREILLDPTRRDALFVLCDNDGVWFSGDGGLHWRALGRPRELDQPQFVGMAMTFGETPVIVAGVQNGGSWRWSGRP
jgi:hypothetical protein